MLFLLFHETGSILRAARQQTARYAEQTNATDANLIACD
jgi:hypothetical protein